MSDRTCENCGRWIEGNETLYRLTMQLVADPPNDAGEIELDDVADARAELEALVARLEAMDEDEVAEANDEVHETFVFNLCPDCRTVIHQRIKVRRNFIP